MLALFLIGSTSCQAQLPAGWSGLDIGGGAAGSNTYAGGVYTISGGGTGIGTGSDQMRFTYTTLASGGNFRLTARVAGFNGVAGSQVGLTVRQGVAATGSIGAVAYRPAGGSGTSPNAFQISSRNTQAGALYPLRNIRNKSTMGVPCFLQLVRIGNNFAVYKSSDGIFWSQIFGTSGSSFSVSGAIQVGFFVASGGSGTATATIDNVNLETSPSLAYESSWIGNNFSSDYDGYVSASVTAMWVAPDGTCYTTGAWDEGGEGGKIYKNGKVVQGFTLNCGHTYEGGITSDGSHLYYFGAISTNANQLYQVNMLGSLSGAYQPLYLQTPLLNPTTGKNSLAGLAYGNGELYVSNALTGQVLVVNPSQTTYGAPKSVARTIVTTTIDTSAVTNPAPQAVYQTAFQSDNISLSIPGLTVGNTYNVRLHLAELTPTDNAVGKRLMNLGVGSQYLPNFDLYATAGAINKAITVTFTGVSPNASGNLAISALRSGGSIDGWAIINGVEILNSNGTTFKMINCGGDATGSWLTTIHEIPSRAFTFTRPGPIAVDNNGNLWIVQEGATFPAINNFNPTPGWAAIKLYNKNGVYQNKQITDVVNPTGLSYDSVTDRLIVAENGPAQNIRIYNVYTGAPTAPVCTSTLGVANGVFAGSTPGVIHDTASGGDARFFGPNGVGIDSTGNIYVACYSGTAQTDIRSFNSAGVMNWSLFGLEFCNTGDFDPTVGASDIWTPTHHYTMNWSGSTAGSEWKLKSYLTNPFAYSYPANLANGSAVYRKIGTTPILYTAGQGFLGPIYIYRFVGEQLVPCGSFTNSGGIRIWVDTNGDGIQQTTEVVVAAQHSNAGVQSFSVDTSGNVYLAMGGNAASNPNVQRFPLQGFNTYGAPVYTTTNSFVSAPAPFNTVWGNHARCVYAGGPNDTMFLMGETTPTASDLNFGGTLACYDHWSTSPVTRFTTVLPNPATSSNFVGGAPPYTDNNGFLYMAFDVANEVSFCSDIWGTIHVIDPEGNLVTNIVPGPELNGLNAWDDQNMGLRAHYNSALAEYDILQEGSGFRARQTLYRVKSLGPFLTPQDIGSIAVAGDSFLDNGVFTEEASGTDIWGTADSFHYDYQMLTGNGTIIARVTSLTDPGHNSYPKAGVMIRETLAAGSTNATTMMTPSSVQGAVFQYRTTTSGITATSHATYAPPYWVKLVRAGNVFTGYTSPNGTTWTQIGTPQTISMATTVYVGLAVTSHYNAAPACVATFDNVKITNP